jgi:hypothetical protein
VRIRLIKLIGGFGLIAFLCIGSIGQIAAAGLVAHVSGGGIQFDGNGFYPGELVQINGIRYDGSTIPYGPATANSAGAITGVVAYSDIALYQIDARGYTSGMHAVSNITGALPYPVVPPGYPYVTPTYPDYDPTVIGSLPINGGYASTGYPYTGAPYGGLYPGGGFNYPVPPSGVTLYPYPNGNGYTGIVGVPTFFPTSPYGVVGAPFAFTGGGWAAGTTVSVWASAPDGSNSAPTTATVGADGSLTDSLTFAVPGTWRVFAKADGMAEPISATVQINAR